MMVRVGCETWLLLFLYRTHRSIYTHPPHPFARLALSLTATQPNTASPPSSITRMLILLSQTLSPCESDGNVTLFVFCLPL